MFFYDFSSIIFLLAAKFILVPIIMMAQWNYGYGVTNWNGSNFSVQSVVISKDHPSHNAQTFPHALLDFSLSFTQALTSLFFMCVIVYLFIYGNEREKNGIIEYPFGYTSYFLFLKIENSSNFYIKYKNS